MSMSGEKVGLAISVEKFTSGKLEVLKELEVDDTPKDGMVKTPELNLSTSRADVLSEGCVIDNSCAWGIDQLVDWAGWVCVMSIEFEVLPGVAGCGDSVVDTLKKGKNKYNDEFEMYVS